MLLNTSDCRRRWWGALVLFLALGMLIWGLTWLRSYLSQSILLFFVYWGSCFLLTMLALGVALVDYWVIRQRLLRHSDKQAQDRAVRDHEQDPSNPPSS